MPALHLALVPRRFILGAAFVVILCAQSVSAQKDQAHAASPPKYDVHAETKMKGTIEELKLSAKGSEKDVAHMLLNDGTATLDIYLCPSFFLLGHKLQERGRDRPHRLKGQTRRG